MKYALLAASVAALTIGFGCGSAQVNRPGETLIATPEPTPPPRRGDLHTSHPAQTPNMAAPAGSVPETDGRSSHGGARSAVSAEDELRSAAEARRVLSAVGRTLDRTRELSRAASE